MFKRVAGRLALWGLLLALALLALIGVLSVTRGTPVEYVIARGDPAGPPAPADTLFVRTVELYAGTSLHPGNRVQVLENGDGTYPLLWRDLRTCQRAVTVQMYFAQPGAIADTMAQVLTECARKKARVLLLLDGFGAQTLAEKWVEKLKAAGVEIAWLRQLRWYTLHKAAERSHARVVVVDGRVGYTGGFGLADYWLGAGRKPDEWRETNVRFEGPAVAQLQAAFGSTWAEATGELLTGDAFFPPVSFKPVADGDSVSPVGVQRPVLRSGPGRAASAERPPPADAPVVARAVAEGTVRAGLLHAVPSTGSTQAERFLALTIAGARRTLYITNAYFVPDDDFRRLLAAAAKRGVDVRIMTTGPRTDVQTTRFAGRFRYEELLRAGVKVYEYQPANMHAKTMSVDGVWGSVGSMNFDNRSLAFNDETTLLVHDSAVVAGMDRMFLEDLRHSREMTVAEMAKRPWWIKARDGGAATLQRVL
ncbi:phospholipase D-like domain-containing protein [Roseisolibacter agri]|uniref:Cardiolipin synthase B n=1 Tax=Roseisolibacter agri TaxID=2014610 RepID=A0AA37VGD7_9BACT|nr:cardiolipin synthase B [Roseisolibacter agri]GLC28349.1 cardiolipin synthase B [Roseisolibacter agri]